MKARLLSTFLLSILVGFTVLQANEGSLRLDLNEENIVEVRFTDKTRVINLKLSNSATLKLKNLTRENIGKKLSVSYMDHILVSATIQAEIPSGRIQISNPSDLIWKEMKKLEGKLTPEPK